MDGLVSMSNELDDVFNSMVDNKVPAIWAKIAYPSLKPLGSWTLDFKMFQDWID
jgi:dynein heavy chain, axonemal